MEDYEKLKSYIREKKMQETVSHDLDELDEFQMEGRGPNFEFSDAVQVGSKIIIGGGLGLLAGVAAIAVAASAAEVVLAGVITKVTGVVGGALGMSLGLKKYKSDKIKSHE